MAKGVYIGIDDVAHKIKSLYIGVDGVARKITKAYIGVDDVARLCWSATVPSATVRITPVPSDINNNKYYMLINGQDYDGNNAESLPVPIGDDIYVTILPNAGNFNIYLIDKNGEELTINYESDPIANQYYQLTVQGDIYVECRANSIIIEGGFEIPM